MEIKTNPIVGACIFLIIFGFVFWGLAYLEKACKDLLKNFKVDYCPQKTNWKSCIISPTILGETCKISDFKYYVTPEGVFLWKKDFMGRDNYYFFNHENYLMTVGISGGIVITLKNKNEPTRQ